jgi:uracil-DNA glycosylase family 4
MNEEFAELVADVREQMKYMREIGVDRVAADPALLTSARLGGAREIAAGSAVPVRPGISPDESARPEFAPPPPREIPEIIIKKIEDRAATPPKEGGSRLSALPSLSKRPTAVPRRKNMAEATQPETAPSVEQPLIVAPTLEGSAETVAQIQEEIGPQCMRCKLSQLGRKQVVHSSGNILAHLMFTGEAPGADEDEQGFPFVGRAGQLLTKIIESIGFRREDVFIGNINRCRPPGNRAPEPDETAACRPFLQREIAVVRPKVIVVLGATAAHNLLETVPRLPRV